MTNFAGRIIRAGDNLDILLGLNAEHQAILEQICGFDWTPISSQVLSDAWENFQWTRASRLTAPGRVTQRTPGFRPLSKNCGAPSLNVMDNKHRRSCILVFTGRAGSKGD